MTQVLDKIPFELDVNGLLGQAHLEPESEDGIAFKALVDNVGIRAKPKAIYKECFIDTKGDDTVTIDGVIFRSNALRKNLDKAERVFAYIATCGREADQTEIPEDDSLKQYWLDLIKAGLLSASVSHLASHLNKRYALDKTATMSPGSGDLTVWPIEQQRELFSLLGDTDSSIGVELTDSFLMKPNKTVSGIRFATEVSFRTCQLCHRENCPSRSAPFDLHLWESVEQ